MRLDGPAPDQYPACMTALPLLLAGLAASPPPLAGGFECPEAGGAAWREVRTDHFVVQTNLSSGRARELAGEVERLYAVLLHALFKTPPRFPGVVRVVALRSDEEFGLFAFDRAGAFYRRGGGEGPVIVVPGTLDLGQRSVIAHELTHHVAAHVFQRQPLWFSEGLAGYMESIGTSGIGDTPTVGGVPKYRLRSVQPWFGGLGRILDPRKATLDEKEYGLAWALVHYLGNRQQAGFADLQGRFARGQDPWQAWREVFPQWDPAAPGAVAALDDEVGRYLAYGKFGYRDVRLPEAQEITERPLDAAAAHGVRLSLLPWTNRGKPLPEGALRAELDEALRHDPGHVRALRQLALLEKDPAARLALAERAVAAHPEDGQAWALLASLLPEEAAERRLAARRRAAELRPEDGGAQNDLAWTLLEEGRSGEALPLARAAAALEPWNPAVLDTLAAVLADLGQCPPALAVQRRACDLLGEGIPEAARRPYLERLADYERQCGPKPGTEAPAAAP